MTKKLGQGSPDSKRENKKRNFWRVKNYEQSKWIGNSEGLSFTIQKHHIKLQLKNSNRKDVYKKNS